MSREKHSLLYSKSAVLGVGHCRIIAILLPQSDTVNLVIFRNQMKDKHKYSVSEKLKFKARPSHIVK